jgi:hypothetical protein
VVLGCVAFALLTAIYPFARSAFRIQVDYNEGWNIYNAERLVSHQLLYPVPYGWQMVNYPILSFSLLAFLHRFTHEYLFTARVVSLLSLLAGCLLVAAIVRRLGGSQRASLLAGFFCLAMFCTSADSYVGMDDPQLLAQVFFLLGLLVYVRWRTSLGAIAAAAALFVFAGSIKHNPLDFPLAVLLDLAIVSWRRTLWFSAWGLILAGVSFALNIHFGGPYFVSEMLAPRVFTMAKLMDSMIDTLGPLLGPVSVAIAAAWTMRHDPRRRIAALLLGTSLVVGSAFSGGAGVWVNTFFSAMVATAIVLGLFLGDLERGCWGWRYKPFATWLPGMLFLWLVIPAMVAGSANPVRMLRKTAEDQRRFDQETAFLKQHPSPQICESLLLCYSAGQPYIYDPFNATRLVHFGKLDPQPMVNDLRSLRYGAIELDQHETGDPAQSERFPTAVISAIHQYYQPALSDEDVTIYVPK